MFLNLFSFSSAVKILIKAGSVVNMTVAKRAVFNHGLVELLNNVAPVAQKGKYVLRIT